MVMGGVDDRQQNSDAVFLLSNLFNNKINVQSAGCIPYGGPILQPPIIYDGILFVMVNAYNEKQKHILAIAKNKQWETL